MDYKGLYPSLIVILISTVVIYARDERFSFVFGLCS